MKRTAQAILLQVIVAAMLNTAAADEPTICILRDRSDSKYEYAYYFSSNEVFLSKAIFPGYASPTWYHLANLPQSIRHESGKWCAAEASASSPSGSETWFSRVLVPAERADRVKLSYFLGSRD